MRNGKAILGRFSLTPCFSRVIAAPARDAAVLTASHGGMATEGQNVETVKAQQRRSGTPLKWCVNDKPRAPLVWFSKVLSARWGTLPACHRSGLPLCKTSKV